jgi:hypothetical protein
MQPFSAKLRIYVIDRSKQDPKTFLKSFPMVNIIFYNQIWRSFTVKVPGGADSMAAALDAKAEAGVCLCARLPCMCAVSACGHLTHTHTHTHACMHACMHVCMYVCMYTCIRAFDRSLVRQHLSISDPFPFPCARPPDPPSCRQRAWMLLACV